MEERGQKILSILLLVMFCIVGFMWYGPKYGSVQYDRIPMVMVDGVLYLDTGRESTIEERCGMMDGTITSTVESWGVPSKNNQSNFGAEYGYQYGATEGTVEICINDRWFIFATEEER